MKKIILTLALVFLATTAYAITPDGYSRNQYCYKNPDDSTGRCTREAYKITSQGKKYFLCDEIA